MENYPIALKTETAYSALTWDAVENKYKYITTITNWCTQEAVNDYKDIQTSHLSATQAFDKETVVAGIQEEIDWVNAALL